MSKGERHLDTPTVTRSYRSSNKMRIQEILDVHKMLEILGPTEQEFKIILLAAATIDAVNRRSGAYGKPPFPPPVEFVEFLFGHDGGEDEPVWPDPEERARSTTMLRCISKLSDYMEDRLPDEADTELALTCPICGDDSVDIVIGNKPRMEDGKLIFDGDETEILDVKILCGCEPFELADVWKFEEQVDNWIDSQ